MKSHWAFRKLLYLISSSTEVAGLKKIVFPKYPVEFSMQQRFRWEGTEIWKGQLLRVLFKMGSIHGLERADLA